MRSALFILSFALLASCNSAYHLKRAERHIKKSEQLGAKINTDTVYVSREIIIPEIKYDTLLQNINFTDTLTVIKDNMGYRLGIALNYDSRSHIFTMDNGVLISH